MGTDKRERQKANRAAKVEAERKAEARKKRMATVRTVLIAGAVIVVFMLLFSMVSCGSSSGGRPGTTAETAGAGTGCPPDDGADEPVIDFQSAPEMCIDPSKTYTATVETTEGTIVLALDTERTPGTTNNFVTLARYGYYDGTDLFRTEATTGIIQGGSPHTQDNSDQGPGYTITDEGGPFTPDDYAPGTIAMANTGQPDSASAQFFFLANEGGRYLAKPDQIGPSAGTYAAFGTVTEGLEVLETIAALDDGTGVPSKTVTIEKVTITES